MRAILQLRGEVRSSFATLKVVPPIKVAASLCRGLFNSKFNCLINCKREILNSYYY